MSGKLAGKTVVVTGAGRGLGAALCRKFGSEGAFVAGCDINGKDLENLADELQQMGVECLTAVCDVSSEAGVSAFFQSIRERGKKVDILINNAGITNIKLFRDNTNEEVMRVMDINFRGCVYTTREAYEDIIANQGSFIAISSVAGFGPLLGRTAYAASKHAVLGFFETLRTEVKHWNAHVLVVCPGFIATNLRDHVYAGSESNENTKHKIGDNASPDEVASLIYKAWERKRPMLVTGIGRVSYFLKRLSPALYERVMANKLKEAFQF